MSNQTLYQVDLLQWFQDHLWMVQNGFLPKAHAIFADPPYFLGSIGKRFGKANSAPAKFGKDGAFQRQSRGFMGKTWDGFEDVWAYQDWVSEWSSLALDYAYPGALMALYGSPRTFHRLVAGLEDAGWEIFETCMFLHGVGFPKSTALSKQIDKHLGAEREIIGYQDSRGDYDGHERNSSAINKNWRDAEGREDYVDLSKKPISLPVTDEAKHWDGYKGLLKPAFEPLVLARAPRGNLSFAELALQFGTGSLNIGGTRIGIEERTYKGSGASPLKMSAIGTGDTGVGILDGHSADLIYSVEGRYPANIGLVCTCESENHAPDCPVRMLDEQSGQSSSTDRVDRDPSMNGGVYGWAGDETRYKRSSGYSDNGGASRFFYTAKPGKFEREAGLDDFEPQTVSDGREKSIDNPFQRGETPRKNTHATVKSIKLNEWVARLLLPPELKEPRTLLVPFAGVASEMIGAHLAGWDQIIGIERESEYCAINEARRKWWSFYTSYEDAEKDYKQEHQTSRAEKADLENKQTGIQLAFPEVEEVKSSIDLEVIKRKSKTMVIDAEQIALFV